MRVGQLSFVQMTEQEIDPTCNPVDPYLMRVRSLSFLTSGVTSKLMLLYL